MLPLGFTEAEESVQLQEQLLHQKQVYQQKQVQKELQSLKLEMLKLER